MCGAFLPTIVFTTNFQLSLSVGVLIVAIVLCSLFILRTRRTVTEPLYIGKRFSACFFCMLCLNDKVKAFCKKEKDSSFYSLLQLTDINP